jgi:hypothetical protein
MLVTHVLDSPPCVQASMLDFTWQVFALAGSTVSSIVGGRMLGSAVHQRRRTERERTSVKRVSA